MVERSKIEIDEVINECNESIDEDTTQYYAMTYEEGVKAALEWVTGDVDEKPFD